MIVFAASSAHQINMLEQILVAKVFNFGGICSKTRMAETDDGVTASSASRTGAGASP
jgi:hypothetical protein